MGDGVGDHGHVVASSPPQMCVTDLCPYGLLLLYMNTGQASAGVEL
jgi:hypothetical protein